MDNSVTRQVSWYVHGGLTVYAGAEGQRLWCDGARSQPIGHPVQREPGLRLSQQGHGNNTQT
eukprot:5507691-Pyramimonas_sp.AAC.1